MKIPPVIVALLLLCFLLWVPWLNRKHAEHFKVYSNTFTNIANTPSLTTAVNEEVTQLKIAILMAGALGFEHGRGYELGIANRSCSNLLALLRMSYDITNDVPELDRIYGR